VARHERELFPLFRQRRRFAGATSFRLYDAVTDGGGVDEHVFAYSNGTGVERSLVVYHDRFGSSGARIRSSVAFAVVGDGGERRLERSTLADALGLSDDPAAVVSFRDPRTGHGLVATVGEIRERGLQLHLGAYENHAWTDIEEHPASDRAWTRLAAELGDRWVPSLDAALADVAASQRREAAATLAADPNRPLASHVPRLEHRLQLDDGRTLAVAEWGDPNGRPVILVHGQPGSRLLAPDPATTEAMGVRLITFDRPGYGESDPLPGRSLADSGDEVADVASRLGLGEVHLVGWSSGGPVALAAIARHPDVVRGVALVASNAAPDDLPTSEWAGSPESLEIAEAALRGDPSARDRAIEKLAWFAEAPTGFVDEQLADDAAAGATGPDARLRARPEVFAALRAHFAEAGRAGAAGFADDWLAWLRPWGFEWEAIDRPVDIWWGDEDQLTSRIHVEALSKRLPTATVRIVPQAGHSLPFTAWREILEALLERDRGSAADRDLGDRGNPG
jgi:pimeloyl-ACP methyl ester carboxylesterase